jgi:hypothetical protein
MQRLLYSGSGNAVNRDNPLTLAEWAKLPPAEQRSRIREVKNLPYTDTPRGHETALVKPGRGE